MSRLGCEYICDMYSRVEDERLDFIKLGKRAEADRFCQSTDNEDGEQEDDDGDNFTLPASFTGSQRYYSDKVADALALARRDGKPDLVITATCNPTWPEILSQLLPGQSATEIPQVTNRVFKVRECYVVTCLLITFNTH